MKEKLKPRIHENGIDYVLVGDYYIPDIRLPDEGDERPIGKWGRTMSGGHRFCADRSEAQTMYRD